MSLDIDISFLYQVATFVVLWLALKTIIFDPTLAVLDARARRTSGAKHDARDFAAQSETARADYEAALRDARAKLAQESEAARQAAHAEHARQIAAARAAAAEQLARQRETVAAQIAEARRSLAAEAQTLAFDMLDRVSGGTPS